MHRQARNLRSWTGPGTSSIISWLAQSAQPKYCYLAVSPGAPAWTSAARRGRHRMKGCDSRAAHLSANCLLGSRSCLVAQRLPMCDDVLIFAIGRKRRSGKCAPVAGVDQSPGSLPASGVTSLRVTALTEIRFGVRVNASVLRRPSQALRRPFGVRERGGEARVARARPGARERGMAARLAPDRTRRAARGAGVTGDRAQRRTMYGSALVLGRIASGGCGRGDAAVRQALSHRVVNSGTAQPHTFAQPQCGSSISHLLAVARAGVIAAAQLSTDQARMREERPPAGRSTEPEPHAALASAANGQPEDR